MLALVRKEWRNFLLALQFFTRIQVPSFADFNETDLNHSAKYFPLIGVVVGVMGAVVYLLSYHIVPNSVAILLSMAATIYITGAFHEDGLADSADGLGGGWDKARILSIMQDSRLGTFGAIALFFALFAKFHLLVSLPTDTVACSLVIANGASRLSAVYMMGTLRYVKSDGKTKPLATSMSRGDVILASILGLLPLLLLWCNMSDAVQSLILLLCLIVPTMLVWLWWRVKIKHWLGGYTGDCLGATQQLAELTIYLGMLVFFGMHL
jgi:adenosylcobinamide-GDP ribazoletransferase